MFTVDVDIDDSGLGLLWGISWGSLGLIETVAGALDLMDSYGRMFVTPINNTLYGCQNWRLVKANTYRIELDAPEPDAPEPDAPEPHTRDPDAPESDTPDLDTPETAATEPDAHHPDTPVPDTTRADAPEENPW